MRQFIVVALSLCFSVSLAAQENTVEYQNKKHKYISPTLGTYKSLSKFELREFSEARKIDSLWLKEMISSGVYAQMMRRNMLEVPQHTDEISVTDYRELPKEVLKRRLEKLNQSSPFNIGYNQKIDKLVRYYLKQNKEWVENLLTLSRYYFPLFEEELAKHDMPLDLKYLAVIESGLNPRIKSRMGATGLWQFMYSSGKMQGLKVSNYVDERMDPIKSTEAAVDYLDKLYRTFDDWDMALAAYNSGPGNVSKAIRRSGGKTNYWELQNYLPRETSNYVPSFIAAMYLFNYADKHGFDAYSPDAFYFATDTVQVKHSIKFDQVSEATGIPKALIEFLNPSYKLDVIPYVEGENYSLRLPLSEVGLFVSNEEMIYDYAKTELEKQKIPTYSEQPDRVRYRVKSGDFLGRIARQFGVSIANLKRWNNLSGNAIRAGQFLTVYPRR